MNAKKVELDIEGMSCLHDARKPPREERLGHARAALARFDSRWAGVKWAEWDGWEGGVPQQENAVDCLLHCWENAVALASGAEGVERRPQLELRGGPARLLTMLGLWRRRAASGGEKAVAPAAVAPQAAAAATATGVPRLSIF